MIPNRWLGAAALCLAAAPAEAQILQRIADRARERARERVEQAVDRAVEGTLDGAEGAARSAGARRPAAAPISGPAPAAPAAPASATPAAPPSGPAAAGDSTARREALATGLRDGDLPWLLPLLRARAADQARVADAAPGAAGAMARVQAEDRAVLDALRSGAADPLEVLRARFGAAWTAAPPGARYDRACSVAATEGQFATGSTDVVAVFTLGVEGPAGGPAALARAAQGPPAEQLGFMLRGGESTPEGKAAAARAVGFYTARGFSHVAPATTTHVLSPRGADGSHASFAVAVSTFNDLAVAPAVSGEACRRLPSGPVVRMVSGDGAALGDRVARAVSPGGRVDGLERALARAGLPADEFGTLLVRLMAASRGVGTERGFFLRHQALLAPLLAAPR